MPGRRVLYRDWIVKLGHDPEAPLKDGLVSDDGDIVSLEDLAQWAKTQTADQADTWGGTSDDDTRRAVAEALGRLDDDERELIERYYYMGQSIREISEKSGRAAHRLESLRRRALRRLKKELAPFVKARFGLTSRNRPECPICRSPDRKEIEQIIDRRDRRRSWKPVMDDLKSRFGLHITSPQTLIGHSKYHQSAEMAKNTRKEKRCRKARKPNSGASNT